MVINELTSHILKNYLVTEGNRSLYRYINLTSVLMKQLNFKYISIFTMCLQLKVFLVVNYNLFFARAKFYCTRTCARNVLSDCFSLHLLNSTKF